MNIALGIDTGGTYTDAVLLRDNKEVIATAKSLTTRHNLADGIAGAIAQLPKELLSQLSLVSLSTTLATNAVVEDQGSEVLGIFSGYNQRQLDKVKIPEIIGNSNTHIILGGHTAGGQVSKELDINAAAEIIRKNHKNVSAIAISSMFSVRNSTHEKKLVEIAKSICDKPVTCGYELAGALDAPRRALTAVLNARLISFIKELIVSVNEILERYNIDAPLMIVKGDGSLVNTKTALDKPVETVLSGPAASVMGASLLSGEKNIIVADMGGTTTDVAIIRNGVPKINQYGAKVGNWSPMINAVEVHAVGLGGDSEVKFGGTGEMVIGPRRVMPMSLLCSKYPEIIEKLKLQKKLSPSPRSNKFAVKQYSNQYLLESLDDHEKIVWEMLDKNPIELEQISFDNRELARAIPRLHRKGMVIYSGFTPSDAAHILGKSSHWSTEGAEIAAEIWIGQMRYVYGLGTWDKKDIIKACQDIVNKVIHLICDTLVQVGLSEGEYGIDSNAIESSSKMIGKLLWGENKNESLFNLNFAKGYTLVAVGAPASSYYNEVAKLIGCNLILPKYGEVSNAIGAVASKVRQHVGITVTQPIQGIFRVHAGDEIRDFDLLDKAQNFAKSYAKEMAIEKAKNSGANNIKVEFSIEENKVNNSVDGNVFFEATVNATAEGTA